MDDEVFVVSDMTVQVHDFPTGSVIGFNGTTEWALDSLQAGQVLWLPREEQLRERLGPAFRRLEATAQGWAVVIVHRGSDENTEDDDLEYRLEDADVECAYALAVLDGT